MSDVEVKDLDGDSKDAKITKWDGECKKLCRKMITTNVPVSNVSLVMPGVTAHDVEKLFEKKVITSNTKVVAVEGYMDAKLGSKSYDIRVDMIKAICRKFGIIGISNFTLHPDRIHTLPLDMFLKRGEAIDYIYMDLCGFLNQDIVEWMVYNSHYGHLKQNIRCGFTSTLSVRKTNENYLNMMRSFDIRTHEFIIPKIERDMKVQMSVAVRDKLYKIINEFFAQQHPKVNNKYAVLSDLINKIFFVIMNNSGVLNDFMVYNDKNEDGRGTPMLFVDVTCDYQNKCHCSNEVMKCVRDKINNTLCGDKYGELIKKAGLNMPESVLDFIDVNKMKEKKRVCFRSTGRVAGTLVQKRKSKGKNIKSVIAGHKAALSRLANKEKDIVKRDEILSAGNKKINEMFYVDAEKSGVSSKLELNNLIMKYGNTNFRASDDIGKRKDCGFLAKEKNGYYFLRRSLDGHDRSVLLTRTKDKKNAQMLADIYIISGYDKHVRNSIHEGTILPELKHLKNLLDTDKREMYVSLREAINEGRQLTFNFKKGGEK